VLVVDRDAATSAFCRAALEPHSIDVIEAPNRLEAIRRIRMDRPDVIVVDVLAGGTSRWHVAADLLDEPAAREVPMILVAMPRKHGERERERLLDQGAGGNIARPPDTAALASAVLDRLETGRTADRATLPAETVLV
jgi:CheY-like chemotaxis protein